MSIFRELVAIKTFREDKAELAMMRQRQSLMKSIQERDISERKLSEFRDFAFRREQALYRELCSKVVKLRDIHDVHQLISDLRQQEHQHQENLNHAERKRTEEADLLEEKQMLHKEASKMKQKFVDLARVYSDEQLAEFERKEDLELEEVASMRRDRADWEDNETDGMEAGL